MERFLISVSKIVVDGKSNYQTSNEKLDATDEGFCWSSFNAINVYFSVCFNVIFSIVSTKVGNNVLYEKC